jgi:molybdopterin converting factor small subunit
MVQVVFTANLQRHVNCPPVRVTGATVAEALECVFSENPALRGYVLDDQGALRKNMVIFVDGRAMKDRRTLGDRLSDGAEVFVMQALTGG